MVSDDRFWIPYIGDGTSVDFAVPFYYFDPVDLYVTLSGANDSIHPVNQALDVTYSVIDSPIDGVRPNGGVVRFIVAPVANATVFIARRTPLTQLNIYAENDPFPAKAHEHGLDRLTLLAQECCSRACQGVADGPPTSGTRRGGGLYQEGDHYHSRIVQMGGVIRWIYADNGAGGLSWAQTSDVVSLIPGID